MNTVSTFRLTFHVSHPTFSALEIENIFKLPTRHSKSVGMSKKTKGGKMLGGKYKRTSISFLLHDDPLQFKDIFVVDLLNKSLKSFKHEYIKKLIETGGECNFLIGIFTSDNVMINFDFDTLKRLSELKISTKLDIYGGPD